jgi:hypothetical protein
MPQNESASAEAAKTLGEIAELVGKCGLGAIIFSLPTVIACFGMYFLAVAIKDPQVSMAKVGVGMFATVFGSGICILLLYIFNSMDLWERLGLSKSSQKQQKDLSELDGRVTVLEKKVSAQEYKVPVTA